MDISNPARETDNEMEMDDDNISSSSTITPTGYATPVSTLRGGLDSDEISGTFPSSSPHRGGRTSTHASQDEVESSFSLRGTPSRTCSIHFNRSARSGQELRS